MLLPLFIYMSLTSEFKYLLLKQFSAAGTREKEANMHVQLDLNENNALRYVGGYVTRAEHQKLKKSKQEKNEFCICLTKMNDDDEKCDDSNNRMSSIDRGGLKAHYTEGFFLFTSIELALLRNYLGQEHPSTSLASMEVITDEGV